MYLKYLNTPGEWNNNTRGKYSQFSEKDFAETMLAFELSPLNDDPAAATGNPEQFQNDLNHAVVHSYCYRSSKVTGGGCSFSMNSMFDWIYNGFSSTQKRVDLSPSIEDALSPTLAHNAIAAIYNPADKEWYRTEGDSWNGNWDPLKDHPAYWGNRYLFSKDPRSWFAKFGTGSSAWYLLSLRESDYAK